MRFMTWPRVWVIRLHNRVDRDKIVGKLILDLISEVYKEIDIRYYHKL
jgi:hypothetical protein